MEVPAVQGVQVGDHGRQDNKFININVERLIIQSTPVTAPGPVVAGKIPQPPPAFQLREDLLSALSKAGPGISVVRAVTGMRGVGKTQIAAAYARMCIEEGWRLVAWVDAEDTAGVLNGLAKVASQLGIKVPKPTRPTEVGELVRNRLEADGDRCLLVFDNVNDVAGLRDFLPSAGKSQVVITSTASRAADFGTSVQVDIFTVAEALAFLRDSTGRNDSRAARVLAEELGRLPLALAQAAAVIAAQRLPYPTYLERLRSKPVQEYLKPRDGEAYPRGVAEAILLSVEAVTANDPTGLCRDLLDTVSMLSATGIPRELLYAGVSVPDPEIDEALGLLANASLLAFGGDGSTVTAHRLVTRVCRERLACDHALLAVGTRIHDLLADRCDTLEEPWRTRSAARDIVQQVIALHENVAPFLKDNDTVLGKALLNRRVWALRCLRDLGDSSLQAIAIGEPLIADLERCRGKDHLDTLSSRNNLAAAYRDAGRMEESIALYKRTVDDRVRVLGKDHPDTLSSRNGLGTAYLLAGRLEEAVPLLERTVDDRVRVLGKDHLDTLSSQNNLAAAYSSAGRVKDAILMHKRTLKARVRVLREDHPDILLSRNNLGLAYLEAGRLEEAVPLLEQTLKDRERMLEKQHPHTLTSQFNLAEAYRKAGRLDEAIALYEQALAGFERNLGRDHPYAETCRNDLAVARRAAGLGKH